MYYDYQRWYDPTTGRFISLDPSAGQLSDPQSQNGYTYARDLPTSLVDPSGGTFLSCNYSLCEGPAFFMSSEDISKIADQYLREICEDNPMICGDVLNYYGYDLNVDPVPLADTGESGLTVQTISPPPAPTITDTTATIDTNPIAVKGSIVERLDPDTIRFTHDSVKPFFQNGKFIPDVANGLSSGAIDPAGVDPIRVVDVNDRLYSLDNRRLLAFKMANVDIPVQRVSLSDPGIAAKFEEAYTTPPWVDGLWVYIRGYFIWPP